MTNTAELESLNNGEHEASAELRTGEQIIAKSLDDIDIVETRVTSELGVTRGTAEAVKLTDEALVGIANFELNSPDFTADERRDAVEDVLVETATELAHGATPNQTALSIFTVSRHPEDISNIVDILNKTHSELPNGEQAAPLLINAIAELNGHRVMKETPGNLEYVTNNESKPEKEATIDAATERAERAAEAGIERSDFQGPEVRKAIKSYYADHEVALTVIEAMVTGTLSQEDKTKLFAAKQPGDDSAESIFSKALKTSAQLYEKGDIIGRNAMIDDMLHDIYREPCIGQQTLEQANIAELAKRKNDIKDLLEPPRWNKEDSIRMEADSIRYAQDAARNETRDAGQLLFHNTLFGRDVIANNSLRGRYEQRGTQDVVNISTAAIEGHSNLIHWSEKYDARGYKQVMQNNVGVDKAMAVTYAAPLGEIVKVAPFARDMQYANVDAKQGRTVEASRIGHEEKEVVGEIGAGAADSFGKDIPSIDRVFWGSDESLEKAAGYGIAIGGADIMKLDPKTGVEMPVVFAIQSRSDQLRNYNDASRKSDEAVALEWRKDIETLSQDEFLRKNGQAIDNIDSGTGYGYANRVTIQDIKLETESPAADWLRGGADVTLGGNDREAPFRDISAQAEPYIRAIQKESIDRFAGTYVVPLRAANMKFDSNSRDNRVSNAYGEGLKKAIARANYPA